MRSSLIKGLVLAAALALVPSVGFAGKGSSIASLLKQASPQLSHHVSKIAAGGGVVVKAACIAASACLLAFTTPDASAVEGLRFPTESAKISGQQDLFQSTKEDKSKTLLPGLLDIKTDWDVATGMYMDNGGKLITTRVATQMQAGSLKAYLTTAYRTHPDLIGKDINKIGSKVRLYTGFSNTWVKDDTFSYGVSDNNAFVSADRTTIYSARNYLLHHSNRWDDLGADVELALLGHEYTDPNALEELEDSYAMRTSGMSFFRTGISFGDLITHDLVHVAAKLNASLGAGDIGIAKLGEVYQTELTDWVGGESELVHTLLARGGANVSMKIGQHLTLGTGIDVTRTIGGNINDGHDGGHTDIGDFDVTRRIISTSVSADVMPMYNISFNYLGEWYNQKVDGSVDGMGDYYDGSSGIWARVTLNKDF
ncbi:MAG: hypothetical protein OYH77_00675 [Pseudomonadota bacterium]|nr:hypothetical protein [Pseudomonadota bacterium]